MLSNFGLDYGIRPMMNLLMDISFIEHFEKAKCEGLAYLPCLNEEGIEEPFEFGFMMRNEEYANRFLDSLILWQDKSNGDSKAVDLEFYEQNNGDYLLSIGPDVRITMDRMIPQHIKDFVYPMSICAYQAKGGMRISHHYRSFRDRYVEGRKIAVRYYIVNDKYQLLKASERYFVKKEFKFSKEGQLTGDSLMNPILNRNISKEKPPKVYPLDERVQSERIEKLRTFFPLIHLKYFEEQWLEEVRSSINKRYIDGQIFQAICNLVLLERLKVENPSGINTNLKGYDLEVIRHLSETYESFDSIFPDDTFFTKQRIEKQIRLDEQYFKNNANK